MARLLCNLPLFATTVAAALPAASPIAVARPIANARSSVEVSALREEISKAASATQVLDRWCVSHHMAPAGAVIAEKIANKPVSATNRLRRMLRLKASEQVQLRHVRLRCDGHILSVARLWYIPSRLPPAMEASLQETDTPFGKVVAPLHLDRRSAGSSSAWPPRNEEAKAAEPPQILFTQRAILSRADGPTIAYVVEDYQHGLLGPPAD